MATDARIAVGLPQHPKTKKLIKRLGQASAWNLVCLILWAASNRSDGSLTGMSVEDIELAADWSGEDGAFVKALVDVRFLDQDADGFVLHDWNEHNPWAAGADMRSAKARWNAAKRHHGIAEADRLVPEYAAIRNASSNASSKDAAHDKQDRSSAPSPSPSPSPSHSVPDGTGAADAAPTARDLVFANGVPLLTVAGVAEKNARSMLAGLCKRNGDEAVAKALAECAKARPVEPVSWLQAVLAGKAPASKQDALEARNRAVADAWIPPELRGAQPQEAH